MLSKLVMLSLHVELKNWLFVLKIWEYTNQYLVTHIQIEKTERNILHKPKHQNQLTLEKSSTTNIYTKIKNSTMGSCKTWYFIVFMVGK